MLLDTYLDNVKKVNDFKASLIVFLRWEWGGREIWLISHIDICNTGNITITAQKRAESAKKNTEIEGGKRKGSGL